MSNYTMSCRQGSRTAPQISLLPHFTPPPEITDFSLERYPPSLPSSGGPLKHVLLCVVGILCLVGACSVVSSASAQFSRSGPDLVYGIGSALNSAVVKAQEESQRHAQRHLEAREEYRRRLGTAKGAEPDHGRYEHDEHIDHHSELVQKLAKSTVKVSRSSLLLRMAALQRDASLDEDAIQQLFPHWRDGTHWHDQEVLHDLVLAVAQLARQRVTEAGAN